jgi:hypothetical protein
MYSDKAIPRRRFLWLPLLIVLTALLCFLVFGRSGRDLGEESAAAIRDAVQRSALQCYAVEGVYPPSLQYLEENYGLAVNQDAYQIIYTPVAENLPPQVQVIRKS